MTYSGLIRAGFFQTLNTIFFSHYYLICALLDPPVMLNAIDSAVGTGGISVQCARALGRVFRHAMFLCVTGHAGELCRGKQKS